MHGCREEICVSRRLIRRVLVANRSTNCRRGQLSRWGMYLDRAVFEARYRCGCFDGQFLSRVGTYKESWSTREMSSDKQGAYIQSTWNSETKTTASGFKHTHLQGFQRGDWKGWTRVKTNYLLYCVVSGCPGFQIVAIVISNLIDARLPPPAFISFQTWIKTIEMLGHRD